MVRKAFGLIGLARLLFACGPVDLGEQTLARWDPAPDAVVFGSEIHPLLLGNCGMSGCHGRDTTFRIHNTDPLNPGATVNHPSELPDPLRSDYYTVLAFSDLDVEEQSRFLVWGSGDEPYHPGKRALPADDRAEIIRWLEANP